MIDRKALWIALTAGFAMIAALIWRLSLLPDWHHVPLDGPGGSQTVDGIKLFIAPGAVILSTLMLYARKFVASGSEEAVRPWRRWANMFAVSNGIVIGLFYAVLIARSFGYGLAVEPATIGRIMLATLGIVLMVAGNVLPKFPALTMRFRFFQLDEWQQNRHHRFIGKMVVAMGLFTVLVAAVLPLVPPAIVFPAGCALWPVLMAAVFWHLSKVKREASPH